MRASSFIAMVAAIAIIFSVITSPDREKAVASSKQAATTPEQLLEGFDKVLNRVEELQRLVELRNDFDVQQVETRLVAFKQELEAEAEAEAVAEAETVSEEPDMQQGTPTPAPVRAQVKSGGSSGSVQYTVVDYCNCAPMASVSYGGSTGSTSSNNIMQRVAANMTQRVDNRVESRVENQQVRVENYQPRWFNQDGRSKTQHAVDYNHQFNPTGMSADEIAMNLDAYHDTYGSDHIHDSAPVQASSNCPGGVCPVNSSTSTRSSTSFSYGPLGLVKWRNR